MDNVDRRRYYGLRIGDTVTCEGRQLKQFSGTAEVVEYGFMDNNRVTVEQDGHRFSCVAEWMDIVTKVEDKITKVEANNDGEHRCKRNYYDF